MPLEWGAKEVEERDSLASSSHDAPLRSSLPLRVDLISVDGVLVTLDSRVELWFKGRERTTERFDRAMDSVPSSRPRTRTYDFPPARREDVLVSLVPPTQHDLARVGLRRRGRTKRWRWRCCVKHRSPTSATASPPPSLTDLFLFLARVVHESDVVSHVEQEQRPRLAARL